MDSERRPPRYVDVRIENLQKQFAGPNEEWLTNDVGADEATIIAQMRQIYGDEFEYRLDCDHIVSGDEKVRDSQGYLEAKYSRAQLAQPSKKLAAAVYGKRRTRREG